MSLGIIVAVTAMLIFVPVFVFSNPTFPSRHRRQSFNMPFPLPPVEGSASAEESQNGTSVSDPNQNPQGNSNLNSSGTQDNGNDDGNPVGKKFNFSGNKDWDSGQTVPTVDSGIPLFPGLNDAVEDKSEETNATATNCLNICDLWEPCPENKTCVMSSNPCKTNCIDKVDNGDGTPTIEKPRSTPGNNFPPFNGCTDPSFLNCIHGNCSGFNCICEEGWQGFICDKPCTLDCVHGSCLVIEEMYKKASEYTKEDMFCNCKHNYEGDRCERLKPDPEETTRMLIIILSCVVPAALLLVLVIAVVLWRMRVIFVLKLVYHFRKFVDDDGKLYDAYVSFSPTSKDEEFVYGLLRPTLENLGKKLYLPARDSPAGDVMSDNILNAVEQSRCTIMIITADYVSNEWNRFEFLIAQHEALKLQQRIIPVILEKVDQECINKDKSLKSILSSIKCLKYPIGKGSLPNSPLSTSSDTTVCGSPTSSAAKPLCEKKEEKFWKRLELTMPKTKKTESQSESAFECLRTKIRRIFHSDSTTLQSHKNHVNLGQSFITLNMTDSFKQGNEDSDKKCQKDSYTNIDLGQIQLNAKV